MRHELYDADLTSAQWTRYCGGNTGTQSGDDTESCVVSAPIPGVPGALALGDSKNPDAQPLRFTGPELEAFVREYAREHHII